MEKCGPLSETISFGRIWPLDVWAKMLKLKKVLKRVRLADWSYMMRLKLERAAEHRHGLLPGAFRTSLRCTRRAATSCTQNFSRSFVDTPAHPNPPVPLPLTWKWEILSSPSLHLLFSSVFSFTVGRDTPLWCFMTPGSHNLTHTKTCS